MRTPLAVFGLCAAAGLAGAQSYSIVAFDNADQTLKVLNVPGGNPPATSVNDLYTFVNPNTQIRSIQRAPDGTFYFDNSPFPPTDPNEAGVIQVDGLFGGAPVESFLTQGDPRMTRGGVTFDADLNTILKNEIPTSDHPDPKYFGLLAVDPATGAITEVFQEDRDNPPPRPRLQRLAGKVKDVFTDDYFVVGLNGGIFEDPGGITDPPDRNFGSTIHRMSIDPNTLQGTETLLVDLSDTAVTGLTDPITFGRGLTIDPGDGTLFVSDGEGDIWRVTLDGGGNFQSITSIVTGFLDERPGGIQYNPFNDTILFTTARGDQIWQVNKDGSNLSLVIDNFDVGAMYLIPAPSTLALLGIGGLVAARRRR